MTRKDDGRYRCRYNPGIVCEQKDNPCNKCGWNPAVARERSEKIREARKAGKAHEPA